MSLHNQLQHSPAEHSRDPHPSNLALRAGLAGLVGPCKGAHRSSLSVERSPGHYLAALDRDCPSTFRGKFLNYKRLKKCLKQCQAQRQPQAGAVAPDDLAGGKAPDIEACRERFFEVLREEVLKANRCFVSTAQAVVGSYQRIEMRRRLACCFPRLLGAGPRRFADLADRAYWSRKYARANAVALRKILKKYDKLCGGQRGRAFLQHCWRLPVGGAFLHSPLLDELKAIQDILHEQRMQEDISRADIALCEVADTGAKGGSQAAAAVKAAAVSSARAGSRQGGGAAAALAGGAGSAAAPECSASFSLQSAGMAGAIIESPTCMLSSSDFEWPLEDGAGSAAGPTSARRASLARASLDASSLSVSAAFFSPGTSPPGPGGAPRLVVRMPGAAGGSQGAAAPQLPAHLERNSISRFKDEDLRCPICLDVLYKPVGLACGHKFCKKCSLESAGLRNAIGTFANLCSYVAASTVCPQCRQPRVYRGALRLRQLDRVIRLRCPEEWEERRQEERTAKAHAVEASAGQVPPVHHWMHAINARDALLGL